MSGLQDRHWVVSHNSYEGRPPATFQVDPFYDAGYRGLEFDIWCDQVGADWCVNHATGWDPALPRLAAYLDRVGRWSVDHPDHQPLFVHLDCKEEELCVPLVAGSLDGLLAAHLTTMYTPAAHRAWQATHTAPGTPPAWPDPHDPALRGRVIPVLSGRSSSRTKRYYGKIAGPSSPCFLDTDRSFGVPYLTDHVINSGYLPDRDYRPVAKRIAARPWLLWRMYDVHDPKVLTRMLSLGVNMFAFDLGEAPASAASILKAGYLR